MTALIKFHTITKIEDNPDGTVTLHYTHPLSAMVAIERAKGQNAAIIKKIHTQTVDKGQLINYYI